MPYRRRFDPRYRYYFKGAHRWRRRRKRTSAGAVLIGLLVVMAIFGLGRGPTEGPVASKGASDPLVNLTQRQGDSSPVEVAADPVKEHPERNNDEAPTGLSEEPLPTTDAASQEPEPKNDESDAAASRESMPAPEGCDADACRHAFSGFAAAHTGKAFVMSDDGQGYWEADPTSVSEAIRRALERCNRGTGTRCRVVQIIGSDS